MAQLFSHHPASTMSSVNDLTVLPKDQGDESGKATISFAELQKLQETVAKQEQQISALERRLRNSCRYFPLARLPQELRIMIWKHTCTPRIILMDWKKAYVDSRSSTPTAKACILKACFCQSSFSTAQRIPISAVCQESRELFKKLYTRVGYATTFVKSRIVYGTFSSKPGQPVYMNFKIDTLSLPDTTPEDGWGLVGGRNFFGPRRIDTQIFEPMFGRLRHMTIYFEYFQELNADVRGPASIPDSKTPDGFALKLLLRFPALEELTIIGHELQRRFISRPTVANPYRSTDFRLMALKERDSKYSYGNRWWELMMAEIVDYEKYMKDYFPGLAHIKVLNVAALEICESPWRDYDPYYVEMGPGEMLEGYLKRSERERRSAMLSESGDSDVE